MEAACNRRRPVKNVEYGERLPKNRRVVLSGGHQDAETGQRTPRMRMIQAKSPARRAASDILAPKTQ